MIPVHSISAAARTCCRDRLTTTHACQVEILPVYMPSSKEKADPKLYAENVRVLMARRLGVPLADAGILDHIRLKHAGLFVDSSGG